MHYLIYARYALCIALCTIYAHYALVNLCSLKAAIPNVKGESRGGPLALAVKLPAAQSRPMSDRAPQSALSVSVQGGVESNPR